MDKRKNRNEGTNSKECIMRYIMIMAFFAALMGFAKTAEAQATQVPCTWSFNGGERDLVTVNVGDKVVVGVITNNEGTPKAPEGWTDGGFKPGACVGYDATTCGVRTWSRVMNTVTGTDPYEGPDVFTFKVENAGCLGDTKTVAITVEAPPPTPDPNEAKWTQPEKDRVIDHVDNAPDGFWGQGYVEAAVGFVTVPNNAFTTKWGRGFGLTVGGKPVRSKNRVWGLKIDGAFKWWRTHVLNNMDLSPTTFDSASDVFAVDIIRAFLDITPVSWLQFDAGGGLGVLTQTWHQTIVRQDSGGGSVSIDDGHTDTVATISPTAQATVLFGRFVGLRLEGTAMVPLRARRYEVGSTRESAYVVPVGTIGIVGQF